jgi:hypothetical protein
MKERKHTQKEEDLKSKTMSIELKKNLNNMKRDKIHYLWKNYILFLVLGQLLG